MSRHLHIPRRIGNLWSNQLIRFMIVGIGNTVFGYSLYVLGLMFGIPYQLALIVATILGAVFNFLTTGRIVFESRSKAKFFAFLAVYAITLVVNVALLTGLVHAGMTKAYAQAVLLPLVVSLSFLLNKHLVFGEVP